MTQWVINICQYIHTSKVNRFKKESKSLRQPGSLVFEIAISHKGVRQNELGGCEEAKMVCSKQLDHAWLFKCDPFKAHLARSVVFVDDCH